MSVRSFKSPFTYAGAVEIEEGFAPQPVTMEVYTNQGFTEVWFETPEVSLVSVSIEIMLWAAEVLKREYPEGS